MWNNDLYMTFCSHRAWLQQQFLICNTATAVKQQEMYNNNNSNQFHTMIRLQNYLVEHIQYLLLAQHFQ